MPRAAAAHPGPPGAVSRLTFFAHGSLDGGDRTVPAWSVAPSFPAHVVVTPGDPFCDDVRRRARHPPLQNLFGAADRFHTKARLAQHPLAFLGQEPVDRRPTVHDAGPA